MRLIIDVQVSDLARAVKFYVEVLGLPLRVHEDSWAAVIVGDAEIHLYVDGGVRDSVEFYVEDVETKVVALTERRVHFISGMHKPSAIAFENGITTFPWGKIAYFTDSEGNELALVTEN